MNEDLILDPDAELDLALDLELVETTLPSSMLMVDVTELDFSIGGQMC